MESLWVAEKLGRPIAKAWNSIGSDSLAKLGTPPGTKGRIALSFAANREEDREITARLIDETGFDAYFAGPLEDSWRQQPGNPAYCSDYPIEELPAKLAAANRVRAPRLRDLGAMIFAERAGDPKTNPDSEFGVKLNRLLTS
ncbi:MAG: hypothetical protein EOP11_01915 [Proteobacteria bacterium]|nr:MAG: hypothetical protein EOP11_01915 [Pseudomonadota bacterium]